MPQGSPADGYRLEFVKICGITNPGDRDLVAESGADFFGVLVDVGFSPRSLDLQKARKLLEHPPLPGVVMLFNPSLNRALEVIAELQPHAVQLLGSESPEFVMSLGSKVTCEVWKSLHLPPKGRGEIDMEHMESLAQDYEDSGADALLFGTIDTTAGASKMGGTGMVSDWGLVLTLMRDRVVPSYLAGGLHSRNVTSALQAVKPVGVDVCTGVERSPGKIDPVSLGEFMNAVSRWRAVEPAGVVNE